jgi:putative transcriptional regulator
MATQRKHHYTECGLDNIYLVNGFRIVQTPRGKSVAIRDVEGLHRAIGLMLVREKKDLDGKEFRFLRHEMNMTQLDLAAILRVDVQSVARWEKGKNKGPIDGPALGLLRVMYEQFVGGNPDIVGPLTRLAELDEEINKYEEGFSFDEAEESWQPSSLAA